ncbi:MAG: hypothetical protein ACI9I0_002048, partial [Rhodoferax sp.]
KKSGRDRGHQAVSELKTEGMAFGFVEWIIHEPSPHPRILFLYGPCLV